MTKKAGFAFAETGWWRHTSYGLREGLICAGDGSTIEMYDPWQQYEVSKVRDDVSAPYLEFIRLGEEIVDAPRADFRMEYGEKAVRALYSPLLRARYRLDRPMVWKGWTGADGKVLKWCSRHGLLVLFPQSVRRFDRRRWWTLHPSGSVSISATVCERLGAVWAENEYREQTNKSRSEINWGGASKVAIPWGDPAYRHPMAYFGGESFDLYGPPNQDRNCQALKLLAPFFPGVPYSSPEIPLPRSEAFYLGYAEPLDQIAREAVGFSRMSRALENGPAERSKAVSEISELLTPATISLSVDADGDIKDRWSSPSLICTFARMLLQDIQGGKRIDRCACCGDWFTTDRGRTRYCSEKCGWRHRKRKSRPPKTNREEQA